MWRPEPQERGFRWKAWGEGRPARLASPTMPTRYLMIASLITALVILVGVGTWFLLGVL